MLIRESLWGLFHHYWHTDTRISTYWYWMLLISPSRDTMHTVCCFKLNSEPTSPHSNASTDPQLDICTTGNSTNKKQDILNMLRKYVWKIQIMKEQVISSRLWYCLKKLTANSAARTLNTLMLLNISSAQGRSTSWWGLLWASVSFVLTSLKRWVR